MEHSSGGFTHLLGLVHLGAAHRFLQRYVTAAPLGISETWNSSTTADPSVTSAAAFIPLNASARMHPSTFFTSFFRCYLRPFGGRRCRGGEGVESVPVVLHTVQPYAHCLCLPERYLLHSTPKMLLRAKPHGVNSLCSP